MNKDSKTVLIVGGPTSSGKTSYALKLAKELNGELINADSRQIYKYLNIGTNKGTLNGDLEKSIDGIPIHLIDFLTPDKRFNVFEWRNAALKVIKEIQFRGNVAIIVGGTGLYIDSLIKEYKFDNNYSVSTDQKSLLKDLDTSNLIMLQNHFKQHLPSVWASLNYSDQNNLRRLQRLVEKFQEEPKVLKETFETISDYVFYYPKYDWEELKQRINTRVEEMFNDGLVEETRNILKLGFDKDCLGLQIMGYKEVIRYLSEEITFDTCKELVKISHRQYARRQRTWFEGDRRKYNLVLENL